MLKEVIKQIIASKDFEMKTETMQLSNTCLISNIFQYY